MSLILNNFYYFSTKAAILVLYSVLNSFIYLYIAPILSPSNETNSKNFDESYIKYFDMLNMCAAKALKASIELL